VARRGGAGLLVTLLLLVVVALGIAFLLTDGRAALDDHFGTDEPTDLSPGDGVLVYPLR
jgi:hypothetical protein